MRDIPPHLDPSVPPPAPAPAAAAPGHDGVYASPPIPVSNTGPSTSAHARLLGLLNGRDMGQAGLAPARTATGTGADLLALLNANAAPSSSSSRPATHASIPPHAAAAQPYPAPYPDPASQTYPAQAPPAHRKAATGGADGGEEDDDAPMPGVEVEAEGDADADADADAENAADVVFRAMAWDDILDDLNARFLVNLPAEETSLVRVYWQAEQAHWFYEDYLRPLNPLLPSLNQRQFTRILIDSSPLYAAAGVDHDAVWDEYCAYKKMVPCCGAIIISAQGDKCLMVRGWKSNAGWCFPRGKINSEESEVACAIREVEEETGFDLTPHIEPGCFVKTLINAQEVTMFLVSGIDEATTVFETQTRNEIGAIEWVRFSELPTWKKAGRKSSKGAKRFYNVTPFVHHIKRYLKEREIKPRPAAAASAGAGGRSLQPFVFDAASSPALLAPPPGPAAPHAQSTLDALFTKFVAKDEPAGARADGFAALFGNLAVVDPTPPSVSPLHATREDEDKDEDYALARLLGSVAPASAPVSASRAPALSATQTKLLSQLSPAPPASAPVTRSPNPDPGPPSLRAHQSDLLSVLSPPQQLAKPASLPTSPLPLDDDDARRQRQRALLEMTIAGMGVDVATAAAAADSRALDPALRPAHAHAPLSAHVSPTQHATHDRKPHSPGAPPPYSAIPGPGLGPSTNHVPQPQPQAYAPPGQLPPVAHRPYAAPPPALAPFASTGAGTANERQRALLGALHGPAVPAPLAAPGAPPAPPAQAQHAHTQPQHSQHSQHAPPPLQSQYHYRPYAQGTGAYGTHAPPPGFRPHQQWRPHPPAPAPAPAPGADLGLGAGPGVGASYPSNYAYGIAYGPNAHPPPPPQQQPYPPFPAGFGAHTHGAQLGVNQGALPHAPYETPAHAAQPFAHPHAQAQQMMQGQGQQQPPQQPQQPHAFLQQRQGRSPVKPGASIAGAGTGTAASMGMGTNMAMGAGVGAGVHQPVARPPVGTGLLGLMGGR
ncbi:mRNA-decapping enzyme subunit 2 [Cryptotrichosporon argae]